MKKQETGKTKSGERSEKERNQISKNNSQNSYQNADTKYPETLEEQRDYYLKLYQKWAKWQKETPERLPKGFRTKEEFDFEEMINLFRNLVKKTEGNFIEGEIFDKFITSKFWRMNQTNFYKLCDFDVEIKEIIIFLFDKSISLGNLKIGTKKLIIGKLYYKNNTVLFIEVSGNLKITCQFNSNHINLSFKDCTFSDITLENFDRGYFSPETNDYLNQMETEGKLTLVNCTWSGLPALRENLEMEEIGKKIWEREIKIEEKYGDLKQILHQYLAWFSDFVETTEGKKIQLRITTGKLNILIEVYSFNGATWQLIEKKFIEFALMTGEEEWKDAVKHITSHNQPFENSFANFSLASKKITMDYVFKMQTQNNGLIKDLATIFTNSQSNFNLHLNQIQQTHQSNSNSMSNYNLNNSANNNSGNLNLGENNQIIDNKISQILANNLDLELRKVLLEIKELKNQIIQNPQIEKSDKEDSLEAVNEIVQNIEKKDKPENQKVIRKAFKTLFPVAGNFSLGLITNAAWEMLKKHFGINF